MYFLVVLTETCIVMHWYQRMGATGVNAHAETTVVAMTKAEER